jgi:hypothetical protein
VNFTSPELRVYSASFVFAQPRLRANLHLYFDQNLWLADFDFTRIIFNNALVSILSHFDCLARSSTIMQQSLAPPALRFSHIPTPISLL